MAIILEAKHILKKFNDVAALSDGNLICREGKITGLLGANGSGKSTISKCITGVYHKNGGEIIYLGKKVDFRNPMETKKAGISMAFQNLSLLPDLTVWQNIALGFEKKNGVFLDDKDSKERSRKILDEFMPNFDCDRLVSALTPAEMQIVEIAKAISVNPKMLILDEPTAALGQTQTKLLFKYMRLLAQRNVGMVFTSHRMWEVMEICDDIVVFRNGKVVGSMDFEKEPKDEDKVIQLITGEEKKTIQKHIYFQAKEELITVSKLSYKDKLRNINLKIGKNEVVGIGGLAGQEEEELLLALAGNYSDLKASVDIDGEKVMLDSPEKAISHGIVLVPGDRQKQGLMMTKSIYENSILTKVASPTEPFVIPQKKYMSECEEEKDILHIKCNSINDSVGGLSGGNAQKVVLGKWIHRNIKLLILSDPAKGVDVGAKKDLYDFCQKLVKERGISILLYASDNEELINNCDRVIIMHDGEIVGELEGDEIQDAAIVSSSLRAKVGNGE